MKKTYKFLPQTLWACLGMAVSLVSPAALPAAHADQQNLLPALTDDTGWTLKKLGHADGKLSYNDEGMVVQISAVDGQPAHLEVDHTGATLAEGKIYLLSFEGRSEEAFALTVHAGDDTPKPHSVGLDQTVYLTPHWTPFRMTFTAHQVTPNHVIVPQFLFGRQTGSVYLRNASLVQLAAPPPPDAGSPKAVPPHAGEVALRGSVRSLLPDGKGCVMWVTGKTVLGRPAIPLEPPSLQTVLWEGAKAALLGKPLALTDIHLGDLIDVAGSRQGSSAVLKARQMEISRGYESSPPGT